MKPAPRTLCFKGGHVWAGGTAPVEPGGLLVEDGKIRAVLNPWEASAAAVSADEVIDTTGCLLMPPLFDGHVHSSAGLLRGTENSLPLELWSYHAIGYGRHCTAYMAVAGIMLTAAEMIRNGIGGYLDHFAQTSFAHEALAAHRASGLRVGFAPFFADLFDEDILGPPLDPETLQRFAPRAPRSADAIRDTFTGLRHAVAAGPDRVTLLLGPNAPQRLSEELWRLWETLGGQLDIGSHTHLLETLPQAVHAKKRWPGGLVGQLDERGLLHARLSVAHANWLTAEDFELLARRGVTVVHNPVSNAMLGSGRMAVTEAAARGVSLALGTDSSNTGGRHDLFEAMRHMFTAGRADGADFRGWVSPGEALRAATEGVRAVTPHGTGGRLEAGDPADVLLIDFQSAGGLDTAPVSAASLVVHGDPRNVRSLMVDGHWLLLDGDIVAFDEAQVISVAREHAARLREAAPRMQADLDRLKAGYTGWHSGFFRNHRCQACARLSAPSHIAQHTSSSGSI